PVRRRGPPRSRGGRLLARRCDSASATRRRPAPASPPRRRPPPRRGRARGTRRPRPVPPASCAGFRLGALAPVALQPGVAVPERGGTRVGVGLRRIGVCEVGACCSGEGG